MDRMPQIWHLNSKCTLYKGWLIGGNTQLMKPRLPFSVLRPPFPSLVSCGLIQNATFGWLRAIPRCTMVLLSSDPSQLEKIAPKRPKCGSIVLLLLHPTCALPGHIYASFCRRA